MVEILNEKNVDHCQNIFYTSYRLYHTCYRLIVLFHSVHINKTLKCWHLDSNYNRLKLPQGFWGLYPILRLNKLMSRLSRLFILTGGISSNLLTTCSLPQNIWIKCCSLSYFTHAVFFTKLSLSDYRHNFRCHKFKQIVFLERITPTTYCKYAKVGVWDWWSFVTKDYSLLPSCIPPCFRQRGLYNLLIWN